MHDFIRAIALFLRTKLSWRTCRRLTSDPHYRVVARDGLLYIEPRETSRSNPVICKGWLKP